MAALQRAGTCWVVPEQGIELCLCHGRAPAPEPWLPSIAGHVRSVGQAVLGLPAWRKGKSKPPSWLPWAPLLSNHLRVHRLVHRQGVLPG